MFFLIGFGLFLLTITLTIIFGGVSKRGDRLVARSGRPTEDTHSPLRTPVVRRNPELPV